VRLRSRKRAATNVERLVSPFEVGQVAARGELEANAEHVPVVIPAAHLPVCGHAKVCCAEEPQDPLTEYRRIRIQNDRVYDMPCPSMLKATETTPSKPNRFACDGYSSSRIEKVAFGSGRCNGGGAPSAHTNPQAAVATASAASARIAVRCIPCRAVVVVESMIAPPFSAGGEIIALGSQGAEDNAVLVGAPVGYEIVCHGGEPSPAENQRHLTAEDRLGELDGCVAAAEVLHSGLETRSWLALES
jgi:hypothetical protein